LLNKPYHNSGVHTAIQETLQRCQGRADDLHYTRFVHRVNVGAIYHQALTGANSIQNTGSCVDVRMVESIGVGSFLLFAIIIIIIIIIITAACITVVMQRSPDGRLYQTRFWATAR
jgi:hypothetical protein